MRLPSLRTAEVALTALLIPVLWIGVDLGIRGSLFSSAGATLQSTYAAGMLLSLLVWGFAMEAARHPHPLVRTAAVSFVGFIAAFGIGLQACAATPSAPRAPGCTLPPARCQALRARLDRSFGASGLSPSER